MTDLRTILRGMTALAVAVFAGALVWLSVSVLIIRSHVRATGTVVQSVKKGSGKDAYYCPVAMFRDQAGVEHTVRASGGSNPPRFPIGTTVSILYYPSNPQDGMIEDGVILWIVPLVLMALAIFDGGVSFAIGYWLDKKAAAIPPIINA